MGKNMNTDDLIRDCYGGSFEENTKSVLQQRFDKAKAAELWEHTKQNYVALVSDLKNAGENELFYILPSVALYRALQAMSKENALEIFREIYYIDGKRGHDYLSNRFREDEDFLQSFPKIFLENENGENCEVIADTPTYTEVHVKKCRFVELARELGSEEICAAFCGIDDVIYTDLHPALHYKRDKTIFGGDGLCNFSMRYSP